MTREPESVSDSSKGKSYFLQLQVPPQQKNTPQSLTGCVAALQLKFNSQIHQALHVKVKALIGKEWDPGLKMGIFGWILMEAGDPKAWGFFEPLSIERSSTSSCIQETNLPLSMTL